MDHTWVILLGEQPISVDSLVQRIVGKEDQQEHQHQMIEILEKVSDQVKKVEHMYSEAVPVLEGQYFTPSVSQTRRAYPSKLSPPPNLPKFLGQEPVPSTEGSIDQWLFQVEGTLATHTEEAVQ